MGFWFYMVFIDSLIPIAMIGFVFYFSKKAPKGIILSLVIGQEAQ